MRDFWYQVFMYSTRDTLVNLSLVCRGFRDFIKNKEEVAMRLWALHPCLERLKNDILSSPFSSILLGAHSYRRTKAAFCAFMESRERVLLIVSYNHFSCLLNSIHTKGLDGKVCIPHTLGTDAYLSLPPELRDRCKKDHLSLKKGIVRGNKVILSAAQPKNTLQHAMKALKPQLVIVDSPKAAGIASVVEIAEMSVHGNGRILWLVDKERLESIGIESFNKYYTEEGIKESKLASKKHPLPKFIKRCVVYYPRRTVFYDPFLINRIWYITKFMRDGDAKEYIEMPTEHSPLDVFPVETIPFNAFSGELMSDIISSILRENGNVVFVGPNYAKYLVGSKLLHPSKLQEELGTAGTLVYVFPSLLTCSTLSIYAVLAMGIKVKVIEFCDHVSYIKGLFKATGKHLERAAHLKLRITKEKLELMNLFPYEELHELFYESVR